VERKLLLREGLNIRKGEGGREGQESFANKQERKRPSNHRWDEEWSSKILPLTRGGGFTGRGDLLGKEGATALSKVDF
jgi:hypothetical protein